MTLCVSIVSSCWETNYINLQKLEKQQDAPNFHSAIVYKMNNSKCGKLIQMTTRYFLTRSFTFQDGGRVKFPTPRKFRLYNSLPTWALLSLIPVGCPPHPSPPPHPSWGKPLIGALPFLYYTFKSSFKKKTTWMTIAYKNGQCLQAPLPRLSLSYYLGA